MFMCLMNGMDYIVLELDQSCLPWTSFRLVPTFGNQIHRFEGNISEMKWLAGHDLEDLLQVCNPYGIKDVSLITMT